MLKVAALVEMIPPEIRHMVFMTTEEANQDYGRLKQRIFAWAIEYLAVLKLIVDVVLGPPSPGESRGRVRTAIFLRTS